MLILPASKFVLPAFDGLYFSTRCVYPILEAGEGRFIAGRSPVEEAAILARSTILYPAFESPAGDAAHLLVGGSGAVEGEGFLALVHRESERRCGCSASQPLKSSYPPPLPETMSMPFPRNIPSQRNGAFAQVNHQRSLEYERMFSSCALKLTMGTSSRNIQCAQAKLAYSRSQRAFKVSN